jgi:hypothetical protein
MNHGILASEIWSGGKLNISKHYIQNNFLQVFKDEVMVIQSVWLLNSGTQCPAVRAIRISFLAQSIGLHCPLDYGGYRRIGYY